MPPMPLTNTAVSNATPKHKSYRLADSEGMYLEVTPKGSKYWRLKYRIAGKEKRLALGVYPTVSLKEARASKVEARRLLSQGVDPSAHRKAIKQGQIVASENSLETLAREWHAKFSPTMAESYSGRILSRFERDIFPWLGSRPIAEISPPELLEAIRRIESRGALESAHRTLRHCGQVYRYAVATGRAQRDITGDLKGALPQAQKKHRAAIVEPVRVGQLLRMIDGYEGTLVVKTALRLAPLIFVRPGELRNMRWNEVDLEVAQWKYIPSKMAKSRAQRSVDTHHIVPLAAQAVELLSELKPLTGRGEFVFPSARTPNGNRPMSNNAVLSAFRRMGIGKDEMCGHGFRAMARTILDQELGYRQDYIEHQLAHEVRDANGRAYNRTTFLAERTKMMQVWSDYLDQLKRVVS